MSDIVWEAVRSFEQDAQRASDQEIRNVIRGVRSEIGAFVCRGFDRWDDGRIITDDTRREIIRALENVLAARRQA